MNLKDYLIEQKEIKLSFIAESMWPTNKGAKGYLSKKLNGDLPWTEKDNEMAKRVLIELGEKLINL